MISTLVIEVWSEIVLSSKLDEDGADVRGEKEAGDIAADGM
jgi:hypothetical protein